MVQSKPRRKKKRQTRGKSKRNSKSPSPERVITTSTTYSPSPFQEYVVSSPFNFDSSVSMISETWSPCPSPCSDKSWHFDIFEEISKKSSYIINWMTDQSATSVAPKSTTSAEYPSPDLRSSSKLTVTMLSEPKSSESRNESETMLVKNTASLPCGPKSVFNPFECIDGMSVWTMESYTSSGTGYLSRVSTGRFSQVIQVKYPWSPRTNSEGAITPAYPSSASLLQYKYPSENEFRNMRNPESIDTINWLGPTVVSHTEFTSFLDNIMLKSNKKVQKDLERIKKRGKKRAYQKNSKI